MLHTHRPMGSNCLNCRCVLLPRGPADGLMALKYLYIQYTLDSLCWGEFPGSLGLTDARGSNVVLIACAHGFWRALGMG